MPALIDVHTHLAYSNFEAKEDIDLYASMESRTIRGMFFAQQVLVDGDLLADLSILLDRDRLKAVICGGKPATLERRGYGQRRVTDFVLTACHDLYTQARVRELVRNV